MTDTPDDIEVALQRHRDDIALIAARFYQEANDQHWCDAVDEIVADINHGISIKMPLRKHKWRVTMTAPVVVAKFIEATTNEQAKLLANNDWFEHVSVDGMNGWTVVRKNALRTDTEITASR